MASSSERAHVHCRRTGGFLGGPPVEVDVGEDDLDPEAAQALARVLESPGSEPLPDADAGVPSADAYQYALTVRRGEQVVSLRFDESRMPPDLLPLVEALEQRAMQRPE